MSKRQQSSEGLLSSDDRRIFPKLNFQYILTAIDNAANACRVTSVLSSCNFQAIPKDSKIALIWGFTEGEMLFIWADENESMLFC